MESSKRRLLIKGITRGLEKVLRVDADYRNKYASEIEGVTLPPRPFEFLTPEEEAEEKRLRQELLIKEVKFILKVTPRHFRERYILCPGIRRLREICAEIDMNALPAELQEDLLRLGIIQ